MYLPLSLIYPLKNVVSPCFGFDFGISRVSSIPGAGTKSMTMNKVVHKQAPCPSISPKKLKHLIHHNPSAVKLIYLDEVPICHNRLVKFESDEVQLGDKVKTISRKLRGNSMEELEIVDTIQRLGMNHLFQEETREVLHRHYIEYFDNSSGIYGCSNCLNEASLRFRLLRQEGYNVSFHTFDGFLDQDRKFKEELAKDTQGLLSLFEASQMSMHGEWILDEANAFSKRILSSSLKTLDEHHTLLVQNALKHPLHKTLPRFTAHDFLGTHSGAKDWRNDLQELAKMDFNATRVIYQNEILHISNWWKELGLAKELKFARDQPLKWHMWSLAMLPDPSMSGQRIEITKAVSFIYIIDDIFDVYGTPEDLSLFTEAINRWEFDTLDMLPEYMKLCLKALFEVTHEISHQIWLKYGRNPKPSLQKAWIDLINAFLVESRWFAEGYLPTATEYLKVATVTAGTHVVVAHMYFLLGGGSNTCECNGQVLNNDYMRIASSTAMILRLWDDFGSSENEEQDGHDGSYIKCYINEQGVSVEAAREHVADLISDAWKSLNQESMQSPPCPLPSMETFSRGCLNLARMVPLMYSYDENHSLPDLERFVTLLLHQKY